MNKRKLMIRNRLTEDAELVTKVSGLFRQKQIALNRCYLLDHKMFKCFQIKIAAIHKIN